MPDNRRLTCIVCPVGCQVDVAWDDNDTMKLSGYTCQRGKAYAENEVRNPVRMITSTVRIENGDRPMLPVKTSKPVPKTLIMACMREINQAAAAAPVESGEPIIRNILGTGADIVATRRVGKTDRT